MGLLIKIGADLSSFKSKMKRATKEISFLGSSISNVGGTLTRGITMPLVGIVVAAGKVGMDFEAQMNRVAAISGATGEELAALEGKARELGSSTMFSATQAAEGLENFSRAGFSVEESLNAIEPSLKLAIATGTDLSTTTDIVANAIRGFGLDAKDAAGLADLLASTAASSNTTLEELGDAFNYVAPLAASYGYTTEDVAEALGHMANAGITGSKAGTTLRRAMGNLVGATGEAKDKMEELGIEVADAEGNLYPLDDVIGDLRQSFAGMSEEEQALTANLLFGEQAQAGMLAVINATEDSIDNLADATTNYNGTVEEQAAIMQSGTKGSLMELKSAAEELAIKLSEVLLPAFQKIIEKVQGFVDKLNALSPEQMNTIMKIMGIVAAVGPLLVVIGKAISIMGKIGQAFKIFSGVLGFASAGPLVLIVAGIAALIAIGVLLYQHWDEIKAWLINAWTTIRDAAVNLWTGISSFFTGLWTSIKTEISTAWNAIKEFFAGIWKGIVEGAKTKFENMKLFFESIWMGITQIFQFYAEIFQMLFSIFTSILQGNWQAAWEMIKTLLANAWNNIKTIFKTALEFVLNLFGTNMDELVEKVTDRIEEIKQTFEDLKEKIKGIIDKITSIWKGFKLPTFTLKMAVKTFLGKTITYPTGFSINWHAEGGIFTRPTILGGHGFGDNPGGKEAILPLNRLPGLLGMDGDKQVVIQVVIDGDVVQEYSDKKLGRRLQGGL